MSNQHRIWSDPVIRAERQAAAEKFMGRPMELEPVAEEPRCAFCRGRLLRVARHASRKQWRVVCQRFDCGLAGPWRASIGLARVAFAAIERGRFRKKKAA